MTRADFAGTFPRKSDADREMSESVAALNLYGQDQVDEDARLYQDLCDDDELEVPARTQTLSNKLSEDGHLSDFGYQLGMDYNDSGWDEVINSLSLSDMENLVLHGYLATSSIDAIGKPRTKEVDGPAQVGSFNQLSYGIGYPNPTVLAQTFNDVLALEYGKQVGQECAAIGVDGWYAPSVNIHRTALGGRNYEYFSEDGLLGQHGRQHRDGLQRHGDVLLHEAPGLQQSGHLPRLAVYLAYRADFARDLPATLCHRG